MLGNLHYGVFLFLFLALLSRTFFHIRRAGMGIGIKERMCSERRQTEEKQNPYGHITFNVMKCIIRIVQMSPLSYVKSTFCVIRHVITYCRKSKGGRLYYTVGL